MEYSKKSSTRMNLLLIAVGTLQEISSEEGGLEKDGRGAFTLAFEGGVGYEDVDGGEGMGCRKIGTGGCSGQQSH